MTISLSGIPTLSTERLVLRAPEADDWPYFNAFMASDRARFVRSGDYSESQTWRSFGHIIGHWALRGFGQFIFAPRETPAQPLGMTGGWCPAGWPEQEIGWTVWHADSEGRGFAHEAAAAAVAHAFGPLAWSTAVSYIDPQNTRSVALAERLGAQKDRGAPYPGDKPILVYRHPRPEALA